MKNNMKKIIYGLLFLAMIMPGFKAMAHTDEDSCTGAFSTSSHCLPTNLCQIDNFSTDKDSITMGSFATLNWTTTNCTNVIISNITSNVGISGSQIVWPTATTTYTLIAYGNSSLVQTKTLTINVNTPVSMTGSLNPARSSCLINQGDSTCSVLFSWLTQNPVSTSAITHNGITIASGNNGSQSFDISFGSQSYYLYNNSQNLSEATVVASCTTGSTWNGFTCQTNINNSCSIDNFTANPSSIDYGQSSYLSWLTAGCSNVSISNLNYNVPVSGSQTIWPTTTTIYTLNAQNNLGLTQTRTVTVYVYRQSNCEINNFSANDTNISDGDGTILRWNTTNCTSVKISNIGYVGEDGSRTVYPNDNTTYLLTAYDSDGTHVNDNVRIYVDNNSNSNSNCYINNFTTNRTSIQSGQPVTLSWSTSGCDNLNISNIGDVSWSGSRIIYPTRTTTYTLNADDNNRSLYRSIQINVDNQIIQPPIYNSNVVTTVATNVTETSAQINGLITGTNYDNPVTYFEYGTDINLGLRTASRSTGNNNNFSEYLTSLSPKTIYYFQAITEGPQGLSRGAIEVFQTLGNQEINIASPVKTVVVSGTTIVNSNSPIKLSIENRFKTIGVGDMVDYTIDYKNISKNKLTNPIIQVVLPKGIDLINYSAGAYTADTRTLSIPMSDLESLNAGTVYLQAKVGNLDPNLAQIVTTAILIYTNPNGAQENAMAYVLNSPKETNLLGASSFFSGMIGIDLIGWLLIIIFILLLVLVARTFYSRRPVNSPTHF